MADKTIDELPLATTVNDADKFIVLQDGTTKQVPRTSLVTSGIPYFHMDIYNGSGGNQLAANETSYVNLEDEDNNTPYFYSIPTGWSLTTLTGTNDTLQVPDGFYHVQWMIWQGAVGVVDYTLEVYGSPPGGSYYTYAGTTRTTITQSVPSTVTWTGRVGGGGALDPAFFRFQRNNQESSIINPVFNVIHVYRLGD